MLRKPNRLRRVTEVSAIADDKHRPSPQADPLTGAAATRWAFPKRPDRSAATGPQPVRPRQRTRWGRALLRARRWRAVQRRQRHGHTGPARRMGRGRPHYTGMLAW